MSVRSWRGIGLLIALTTGAAPARAAPVYLECLLSGGGNSGDVLWNITLNEETSTVSWTIPAMDVANNSRAVFTPDEVRWDSSISTFTINRSDLTFTRTLNMGGGTPHITRGRCRLAAQRRRAF